MKVKRARCEREETGSDLDVRDAVQHRTLGLRKIKERAKTVKGERKRQSGKQEG